MRQQSLFDVGTPKQKLERGLCPIGRCMDKTNEGFDNDDETSEDFLANGDPECCCVDCFHNNSVTHASGMRLCAACPYGDNGELAWSHDDQD